MSRSFFVMLGLVFQLLLGSVAADTDPTPDQYCFLGCQTALSYETFAGSPSITDGYYDYQCGNQLYVTSVCLCSQTYCSAQETKSGLKFANSTCQLYSTVPLASCGEDSGIAAQTVQQLAYGDLPAEVESPAIPDQPFFTLGYETISSWYETQHTHLIYSEAMFIFWGAVVFVGIAFNAWSRFMSPSIPTQTQVLSTELQMSKRSSGSRLWRSFRANILYPATFGHHCQTPIGQSTIPPRLEAIVIGAYIIINVVLVATRYSAFDNNLYYAQKSIQIWRYFSDRNGYLAYANLAILWLFAMRNNILLWLTGWTFATFNRFHRWVARIATLQAVLHAVGYTVFTFLSGGAADYYSSFLEQYWYCGVIAVTAMSLLMGFSVLYLRVRFYDLFLVIHIALALITLVTLFYHTKIFDGQFDGFLWPCVAFWGFDRLLRIGRVLYHWAFAPKGTALMHYDQDADLIHVDVSSIVGRNTPRAGSHYFIYTPTSMFGWESHPFTLTKWTETKQSQPGTPTSQCSYQEKSGVTTTVSRRSSEGVEDKYGFLIRPHKGFTARLRKSLMSRSRPVRVLLEGPYGEAPHLGQFDSILFIMGGSGIPVAISYITEALQRSNPPKMHLVWAARNAELLSSIMRNELSMAAQSDRVTIETYVTRPASGSNLKELTAKHRPDVGASIHEAAQASTGSLAVVVCGPAQMADDARAAVVAELHAGHGHVSLFAENFGW